MKRKIAFTALACALLAAFSYLTDYGVLRYRVATGRQPFGTVTVYRYYSIAEKNRKTEYVFDRAAPETCVHSLFPHLGYSPCWYLNRHTEQRVEM